MQSQNHRLDGRQSWLLCLIDAISVYGFSIVSDHHGQLQRARSVLKVTGPDMVRIWLVDDWFGKRVTYNATVSDEIIVSVMGWEDWLSRQSRRHWINAKGFVTKQGSISHKQKF
ncbi:hypothetical protein SARC_16105 [Sphaeroforma arctica JP610]|uniref:Uncharacterized protein n=1 Tax=Sphaeroforma arctica JP610 TaxID=667725 RepID=A0A0L0F413_9EUKA|nr:hypothetical protein SARC_16105 [Sphaeroforma arctica JP610]KNC71356.1 hypothetical protein SARC_16105 [Sphaeroforma arctica JP610]|eukprot:XP_014145258.1 hypothetical protein SARC_16105 [Sphaeroforma arctica JP610]